MKRCAVLLIGLTASALASGCQRFVEHPFGGYAYDPVNDCLETSGVIDVVAGPDPGQCPMLRCWQSPCGTIYVTDEACDAPPDYQDLTHATAGLCVKALAAYGRMGHGMCPADLDAGLGCGLP
jgi:hypothetical protein